jgi:hypothetical protein
VFIVGIIAMVLMIIGLYLLFFAPALAPIFSLASPFRTWALVFIAIGISLTGITFFGFYRYYDSFIALSVSLFSLLSGWPMVLSDLLLYNPTVLTPGSYPYDYSPGPLYPLYHFSAIIGTLLLAITFIAWTIVFLRTRPFIPAPTLTVVASLFWVLISHYYIFQMILILISGGNPFVLFSLYLSQLSMFMIVAGEPAAILSALIFYRIRK